MKKVISILLVVILCSLSIACFAACDKDDSDANLNLLLEKFDNNLFAESYIDYAKECEMDTDTYPDMAEMGLFWTTERDGKIVLVAADSEEGAQLVSANKPTIINVHGMLVGGNLYQEQYLCPTDLVVGSEIGQENEQVSMVKLWLDKGYNVGVFHYNRFATDISPALIESRVWSTTGTSNMSMKHADGTISNHVSDYSIAEIFAAEYLRAVNLLPDEFGTSEIRVASHSMGGVVCAAGLFLLTELSRVGQVSATKLPCRYAMLDSYFSANSGGKYLGPKDILINWSKKSLVNNNSGFTIVECLKVLDYYGVALEYYTNNGSALNKTIELSCDEELRKICSYTFVSSIYNHNGIREWYLLSLLNNQIKLDDGTVAPSASATLDEIKSLKGKSFYQTSGIDTYLPTDDGFALND